MSSSFVAVLMGSDSDIPIMQAGMDVLTKLEVPFEARITSAHRTPDDTRAYVQDADARGCAVFIAGAGMAAHLAGAVAAHTLKPVIGIPIDSGPLQGLDALLSTVQMPGGIPVATVAIGKAGARNAGYLAAQIMAISDEKLMHLLMQDRKSNAESIQEKSLSLQNSLTTKQ
ncbi:MAG: 5-(carboxyamino)imidazole ribonucleotide mutase [Pseudomonadales bacterium]|jgi:5-(carboxyamino)imidazole ribonucleotide mutase|nr:5-(carboxyamino)imidazole ribonucleotide mutase [Pseudomonadales bacterium]MDP7360929.1 5-(carboxyamino)imidazole ribonucleotide mutase [Pseudomonadales bacterium]HJN52062.1 5-(carboxyamino)imidazole ribonucleotide mutase [Pseudomonadales bacterium]|tara:strand:+ start:189 stop:701 length:513 start_codon:yes stop_codon:yes gene_type:complete